MNLKSGWNRFKDIWVGSLQNGEQKKVIAHGIPLFYCYGLMVESGLVAVSILLSIYSETFSVACSLSSYSPCPCSPQ